MISYDNVATRRYTTDEDFTEEHYRKRLRLAKAKRKFSGYDSIPWGSRFVLWRHDLDFSLNRSLALAHIESEEEVKTTYFLNPHSEFYNLADKSQHKIVEDIISLGHNLGLHLDVAFLGTTSEKALEFDIKRESRLLQELWGSNPVAFSFHNPRALHLSFEEEQYGGLVNCYSRRFKEQVVYCSDSNGYWRFNRLYDVLCSDNNCHLQVLTHPGWWQKRSMPPRQRIFCCSYGKAANLMHQYDEQICHHGRLNH